MITFITLSSVFIAILINQILKDRKEYFEYHSKKSGILTHNEMDSALVT